MGGSERERWEERERGSEGEVEREEREGERMTGRGGESRGVYFILSLLK